MVMGEEGKDAHALLFPLSTQGHINPILQFGKRLAARGIRVTIVTTIFVGKSMVADETGPINLETISDGFDDGFKAEKDVKYGSYLETFEIVGSRTLSELIQKFSSSDCPVTCLVYDSLIHWGLDVARKYGLVAASFFTQSLAVDLIYYNVHLGNLDATPSVDTISLPGLPPLKQADLPSFVYDPNQVMPGMLDFLLSQFRTVDDADLVICNTFQALEPEELSWLRTKWKAKVIGPTVPSMYLDKQLEDDKDYGLSLWKKEDEVCNNWLQDKKPGSVIYISFGSLIKLNTEQTEEIVYALKETNCYFLWVVTDSEKSTIFPPSFLEEIEASGKGLLVNWAPQLELLSNEAIGCFVTHCGWNSTLEGLSLGVPMVAFPYWSDQPTNAKYIEDVFEVGVRVKAGENNLVGRDEVQRCIREMMEGETREKVMANAAEWKELAVQALLKGGSSDLDIDEIVATVNLAKLNLKPV